MGILTAIFSYIASVIGAGFASGQEIVSFFVRYGKVSIWGIALSAFIFGFFEYCVLDDCRKYGITSYDEYTERIASARVGIFVKYLTLIFSGICFCTMAAGGGAMFSQIFGISKLWGNVVICGLSVLLLIPKNQAALKYNAVLGCVIVIGIISCCMYILCFREHQTFYNVGKTTVSAISYAGYNLITAGVVSVKLSTLLKSRRDAVFAGIFTFFALLFVMGLMWAVLSIYYGKINLGELPMLTMAARQNRPLFAIYSVMLLLSILTTAAACAVGVSEICGKMCALPVLVVCALTFGASGFSVLINVAYRVCGYFGIIFTIYVITKKIKTDKKERIKEDLKENQ